MLKGIIMCVENPDAWQPIDPDYNIKPGGLRVKLFNIPLLTCNVALRAHSIQHMITFPS